MCTTGTGMVFTSTLSAHRFRFEYQLVGNTPVWILIWIDWIRGFDQYMYMGIIL